jgi:hypothetical protein
MGRAQIEHVVVDCTGHLQSDESIFGLLDVYWHILDHDDIHKKHFLPIAREMSKKFKSTKKLNRDEYTECWMPMVKEGCLDYYKEHKLKGHPRKVFDKEFCKEMCHKLAERYIEDIRKDEYKFGD